MTIIKIKKMLETLLQYEDSEIIHTIYSVHNTFPLSYSKELKTFQLRNVETGEIERFTDAETTSIALYKIISTGEKEVTE
ncbi:hypothetical protein [Priestia megaterium]|uniref:hypothetical protein n=1 Tax=Priestia megaterium TaxID=1404 RepID=UPI00221E8ED2|nr:hypothetical protein OHU75_26830 [Priestia megaterium]